MKQIIRNTLSCFCLSALALVLPAHVLFSASAIKYVTQWGVNGLGPGQFSNPWGIAADSTGAVYVAQQTGQRVEKFDSTGAYITQWGSQGTDPGLFYYPAQIALDNAGKIYVADSYNHRVQVFTSTGGYLNQWGSGELDISYGIAVDSASNVYVGDVVQHRITKFDSTGTFITQWGTNGTDNGQFNQPCAVAIGPAGTVYVADTMNHRIQVFTSTGGYLNQWGVVGSDNGQFNQPWGVCTDNAGNVYVADRMNDRIQVFTSTGGYLSQWGGLGAGQGQFHEPCGVTVDGNGNIYVSDLLNYRAQKFQQVPIVTFTGKITQPDGTTGIGSALVQAFQDGVVQASATCDGSGNYSLTLPAWTYDLFVSSAGFTGRFSPGETVYDGQTLNESLSPARSGLIGYWSFDEGAGTVALDYSGNNYNGFITNAAVTAGKFSKALNFPGNAYVGIPNTSGLNVTAAGFTVECWARCTASGYNVMVGKHYGGIGFYMDLINNAALEFFDGGHIMDVTFAYNDSQWHHYTGTYDGAIQRLYIDGGLVNSFSHDTQVPSSVNIAIGQCSIENPACPFNGDIDEVHLYNRALTPAEISADAQMAGTISGKITRLNAAIPLNGALVEAVRDDVVMSSVTADVNGNYAVTLATGTYDLQASKTGFQAASSTTINVPVDSLKIINMRLPQNPSLTPTGLAQAAVYTTSAAVSWDNVGAAIYVVERAPDNLGSPGSWSFVVPQASSFTGTAYLDPGLSAETTYWYRVSSYNGDGVKNNTPSDQLSVLTLPPAPSAFSCIITGTSTINWAWTDAGTCESGFKVRNLDGNILAVLSGQTTYWVEKNLQANLSYARYVVSFNPSGESLPSGTTSRYTLANSPTGLINTSVFFTSATISWLNAGATCYAIERAPDNLGIPGSWSYIVNLSSHYIATTYTDTSLSGETTYWYQVKSYNGDGVINNTPGSPLSVLTLPPAPSAFSGIATGTDTINWDWTDADVCETGFRVKTSTGSGGVVKNLLNGATYWVEAGLQPNTQYTNYVVAYNPSGESLPSGTTSRYTLANSPTGLSQASIYFTSTTISWLNAGATCYAIERAPDNAGTPGSWSFVVNLSSNFIATTYADTDLSPETTYWYRVKSYNGDGVINGTPSNVISALTLPPGPSGFSGIVLSTSSINWIWQVNSNHETGYKIYASTDGIIARVGAGTTQWIETNLQSNTRYNQYVSAYNPSGQMNSNQFSLYTLAQPPSNLIGSAPAVGFTSASLSWTGYDATQYAVERATDSAGIPGAYAAIKGWSDSITGTTYQDTSLSGDATYWYRIKSYNQEGVINSTPSNAASVYIRSTVLDHYEVTASTGLTTAGQAFSVTINAKNHTADTITNFSGAVALQAVLAGNTSLAGAGVPGVTGAQITNGTATIGAETYTKAEGIKIKVTDAGGKTGFSDAITVGPGAPAKLALAATPGSILAGQFSVVTATVTDVYDNAEPGFVVNFSVIKGSGSIDVSSGTTNAGGLVSAVFTNPVIGTEVDTVRAASPGLSADITINTAVLVTANVGGTIGAARDPDTQVIIPSNAVSANVKVTIQLAGDLDGGENTVVNAANQDAAGKTVPATVRAFSALKNDGTAYGDFNSLVTIDIPYADADNDGIVDGTSLKVAELKLLRLNETARRWEKVADGGVNGPDRTNKCVRAQVQHFSVYTLGVAAEATLDNIVVYPNPVNFATAVNGTIKFDKLSENPTIKIFDVTGRLVYTLNPGAPGNDGLGGRAEWDGRNTDGQAVAMGAYIYRVTDEAGHKKIGRLCVVK